MTDDLLVRECERFGQTLQTIIDGTVGPGAAAFELVVDSGSECRIGPGPLFGGDGQFPFRDIPLVRRCDSPDQPTVFLRVSFTCELDAEGEHMAVKKSTFGLFLKVLAKKKPRPLVRVEYERDQTPDTPNAHVHLHAVSQELGWLRGGAGQPFKEMQDLHFPVGGRRFRPTVEEFLFFLHREELFTDWAVEGWRTNLKASQGDWEERQAKATVRRHEEVAVAYLRERGYDIEGPQRST